MVARSSGLDLLVAALGHRQVWVYHNIIANFWETSLEASKHLLQNAPHPAAHVICGMWSQETGVSLKLPLVCTGGRLLILGYCMGVEQQEPWPISFQAQLCSEFNSIAPSLLPSPCTIPSLPC